MINKQVKEATVPADHTVLTQTYVESSITKAGGFTLFGTRSRDTNTSDSTQKPMSCYSAVILIQILAFSKESNVIGDERIELVHCPLLTEGPQHLTSTGCLGIYLKVLFDPKLYD